MQVSVENIGKLERKLTVTCPRQRFDTQVSDRMAEMSRTVRLKGFRPGKVPKTLIQQRFGEQIRDEVLSDLIGTTLREAFEQKDLQPVADPSIDVTHPPESGNLSYTATFEVMPELPDIDVSKLAIDRQVAEVTDADVERMIYTLRQQRRRFDVVERAAQEGDFVMFDYQARLDTGLVPEKNMQRAGHILGSEQDFKALDEALMSRSASESFETAVTFPEQFRNQELAGKNAMVSFSIVNVQSPHLPDVNADFVQLFGIANGDLETFKQAIRANLERELKANLLTRLKSEVAEKLATAYADLDVPEMLINGEAENLASSSLAKDQSSPSPELVASARPVARKRVLAGLLMGEVARRQDIKVDNARVLEQLHSIASTYEDPEKVITLYRKDSKLMSELHSRVIEDQVVEWVVKHATTNVQEASFEEIMQPGSR